MLALPIRCLFTLPVGTAGTELGIGNYTVREIKVIDGANVSLPKGGNRVTRIRLKGRDPRAATYSDKNWINGEMERNRIVAASRL